MHYLKTIFGCYINTSLGDELGDVFEEYIWGEEGVKDTLEKLNSEDYGKDIVLILFEFYVNPIPYLQDQLVEIDKYSKRNKEIGIPIVVNEDNFFSKSEEGRYKFLINEIFRKLELLQEVVEKKKLDTKMEQLKVDFLGLWGKD